jgi:zinc protease
MHRGILAKIPENQKTLLTNLQHKSVAQDAIMLAKNNRKTKVEKGKVVNKISIGSQIKFTYPKPKSFELKNGLHFIYHDNRATPQISLLLNLKTSYLYDAPEKGGLFALMMQIMIERTALRTAEEMAQYLETRGIYLNATSETISIQCLNQDFESALKILNEVLTQPSFDDQTIEKIKQRVINELQEYWDTPLDFVDQLARELHYQQHPYSKNPLGSIESISKITKEDLQQCYKNFISPQDASAVIVGSLEDINLPKLAEKIFNTWVGPKIPSIQYSQTPHQNTQNISHPINRDQVVLAFIAPSVSRTDKLFNTIAILDIIITGGANGNFNSRLFALREESGLFYTIGGSLLYGAREEPGMMFIKTVVSSDKVGEAQKKVLGVLKNVGKLGVTKEEFAQAKNQLLSSTVELFESNIQMASTFLFLKKFNMCLNLFDKLGDILSIIKLEDVNEIASKLCDDRLFSTIIIGKLQKKAKRVVSK